MANTINEKARDAAGAAKDAGRDVMDKAKDVGHQAADKARDVASRVGDVAGSAMNTAGTKADNLASSVGGHAHTAADAIRQHGPQSGMLGNATKAVADAVDQSGRYLQQEGVTGMMGDVTEMIKRNPIPALFLGIGIGYLLGRALDRS